ncbi:EVE domain-containing protein [Puniceicoccus vermicola]|uniref:EVE domain-containing protein n=1 Tax=Puniceicoccus vermicola TaxID=388746 RepID=A0A7X1B235_9BACT|nr:EVE domain-containing protein [Puniceicoccus vermicola]MBC2604201.1 EVE domain-containing protein [Puniceicoccus vermicola]
MKNYWLMKSEPDAFSIEDLEKRENGTEPWDGIRNYQARNFMRDDMKIGDAVLFYHSNCKTPGVVGVAEIASEAYPDPTAFDSKSKYFDEKSDPENPRWILVDVRFVDKLPRTVSLSEMKETAALKDMKILQRGNRLSITPVAKKEFDHILKMAKS